MAEQIPTQAGPETELFGAQGDKSGLHIASREDVIEEAARADRLNVILRRGDIRDQAAEGRDRRAESRSHGREGDATAGIDRDWAGRDRDFAAADRADLVGLLHEQHQEVGQATEPAAWSRATNAEHE